MTDFCEPLLNPACEEEEANPSAIWGVRKRANVDSYVAFFTAYDLFWFRTKPREIMYMYLNIVPFAYLETYPRMLTLFLDIYVLIWESLVRSWTTGW